VDNRVYRTDEHVLVVHRSIPIFQVIGVHFALLDGDKFSCNTWGLELSMQKAGGHKLFFFLAWRVRAWAPAEAQLQYLGTRAANDASARPGACWAVLVPTHNVEYTQCACRLEDSQAVCNLGMVIRSGGAHRQCCASEVHSLSKCCQSVLLVLVETYVLGMIGSSSCV
jgi:hypothetical protein